MSNIFNIGYTQFDRKLCKNYSHYLEILFPNFKIYKYQIIIKIKNGIFSIKYIKCVKNNEEININETKFKNKFNILLENDNINTIAIRVVYKNEDSSHSNVLLYNKINDEMELFEPHGETKIGFDKESLINIQDELHYKIKDIFGFKKVLFYYPLDYCPKKSFQSFDKDLLKNEKGYCLAWTNWYLYLRLKKSDIKRDDIIKYATNKFLGKYDIRFTQFIRNFSSFLYYMDYALNVDQNPNKKTLDNIIFTVIVQFFNIFDINYLIGDIVLQKTDKNNLQNLLKKMIKKNNFNISKTILKYYKTLIDQDIINILLKYNVDLNNLTIYEIKIIANSLINNENDKYKLLELYRLLFDKFYLYKFNTFTITSSLKNNYCPYNYRIINFFPYNARDSNCIPFYKKLLSDDTYINENINKIILLLDYKTFDSLYDELYGNIDFQKNEYNYFKKIRNIISILSDENIEYIKNTFNRCLLINILQSDYILKKNKEDIKNLIITLLA